MYTCNYCVGNGQWSSWTCGQCITSGSCGIGEQICSRTCDGFVCPVRKTEVDVRFCIVYSRPGMIITQLMCTISILHSAMLHTGVRVETGLGHLDYLGHMGYPVVLVMLYLVSSAL